MKEMELPSGLSINYAGILNDWAVTEDDLAALKPQLDELWLASDRLRQEGIVDGHLSKDGAPEPVLFFRLPYVEEGAINTPAVMDELDQLSSYARENIDTVVSFGIGGSYLGNKVLFDVHGGPFWNAMTAKERNGYPTIHFAGHTVDARYIQGLCKSLKQSQMHKQLTDGFESPYKVMLVVISKSGSTIEPMANFMVVEKYLKEAGIDYEVVAVTDTRGGQEPTILRDMADKNHWRVFSVPHGVGGRFSIFSEVGLVMGALMGLDIHQFLAGARAMDQACQNRDIHQNPALLSAALKYVAAEKYGRHIEVFMPYGQCLHSLSDWYVQLLAESLGKHRADGSLYGRTPVAAVGTTDMHAQVQEHQEGRLDKVVQFIKVKEWAEDITVPDTYASYPKVDVFANTGLTDILNVALDSNREALSSDHRFNMTVEIPQLNAFYLGQLMYMYCWAIFFESQLAGVDAFDQPGVEVYKRLLGPKLQGVKGK